MSSLIGKMVTYNGGKDSYSGCDSPDNLIVGKAYRVIGEDVKSFQTNLYLSGVSGRFNSVWFNEAIAEKASEVKEKKEWLAIANIYCLPNTLVGKRISLQRLHEDKCLLEQVTTSTIINVKKVGQNVYFIETDNSVYVTKLKIRTGN